MTGIKAIDETLSNIMGAHIGRRLTVVMRGDKGRKEMTLKGKVVSLYPHGFLFKAHRGKTFVSYVDIYTASSRILDAKIGKEISMASAHLRARSVDFTALTTGEQLELSNRRRNLLFPEMSRLIKAS